MTQREAQGRAGGVLPVDRDGPVQQLVQLEHQVPLSGHLGQLKIGEGASRSWGVRTASVAARARNQRHGCLTAPLFATYPKLTGKGGKITDGADRTAGRRRV